MAAAVTEATEAVTEDTAAGSVPGVAVALVTGRATPSQSVTHTPRG
jgi:hypothetical protein